MNGRGVELLFPKILSTMKKLQTSTSIPAVAVSLPKLAPESSHHNKADDLLQNPPQKSREKRDPTWPTACSPPPRIMREPCLFAQ